MTDTGDPGSPTEELLTFNPAAFEDSTTHAPAEDPGADFPCPDSSTADHPTLWYLHFDLVSLAELWFDRNTDSSATVGTVALTTAGGEAWASVTTFAGSGSAAVLLTMSDDGPGSPPNGVVDAFTTAKFTDSSTANDSSAPAVPFPLNEE